MIERQLDSEKAEIRIMERSPHSSLRIFAESMLKSGYISDVEKGLLENWLQLLTESSTVNLELDGIVYVRTSVAVAIDRISFRNREGENHLTEEYADRIDKEHEEWLTKEVDSKKVVIMDGDKSGKDIVKEYRRIIDWVKQKKMDKDGVWLEY
jgi:deoxyadenosine/deoxycytidine kinase